MNELLDELRRIVSKIAGAQLRHTSRLDQIEDRLHVMDGRLAEVDSSLARMDGKLDRLLELLEPPTS